MSSNPPKNIPDFGSLKVKTNNFEAKHAKKVYKGDSDKVDLDRKKKKDMSNDPNPKTSEEKDQIYIEDQNDEKDKKVKVKSQSNKNDKNDEKSQVNEYDEELIFDINCDP